MTDKIIELLQIHGVLVVLCGIGEMVTWGTAETSRLTVLVTGFSFTENLGLFGTIAALVDFAWDWFSNLVGILFFSYSFFEGEWQLIRYILFIPLGVGIASAIVSVLRGTSA